jgi:hypothetical protein
LSAAEHERMHFQQVFAEVPGPFNQPVGHLHFVVVPLTEQVEPTSQPPFFVVQAEHAGTEAHAAGYLVVEALHCSKLTTQEVRLIGNANG